MMSVFGGLAAIDAFNKAWHGLADKAVTSAASLKSGKLLPMYLAGANSQMNVTRHSVLMPKNVAQSAVTLSGKR